MQKNQIGFIVHARIMVMQSWYESTEIFFFHILLLETEAIWTGLLIEFENNSMGESV